MCSQNNLLDRASHIKTLHLQCIASAFVLHRVHPHPKIPLQKPKLHLFVLSAHSRKNKSESYELLLKQSSTVAKTLRNYRYYSEGLAFST